MTFALFLSLVVGSMTLHEYAHAFVADRYGDKTPRRYGRLTLNPFAHLRYFARGLAPLPMFEPMPMDRERLGDYRFGLAIVAGPLTNLALAALGVLYGWRPLFDVNIILFVVNLMPVPPLDGWQLLRLAIAKANR